MRRITLIAVIASLFTALLVAAPAVADPGDPDAGFRTGGVASELFVAKLSADGAPVSGYGTGGVTSEDLGFVHSYPSASVGADGSVAFVAQSMGVPLNSFSYVFSAAGVSRGFDSPFPEYSLGIIPDGCMSSATGPAAW